MVFCRNDAQILKICKLFQLFELFKLFEGCAREKFKKFENYGLGHPRHWPEPWPDMVFVTITFHYIWPLPQLPFILNGLCQGVLFILCGICHSDSSLYMDFATITIHFICFCNNYYGFYMAFATPTLQFIWALPGVNFDFTWLLPNLLFILYGFCHNYYSF